MAGFFTHSDTLTKSLPLLPQCSLCRLDKGCRNPKMKVDGEGKQKVLIIGEAPGAEEDLRGIPFCGPAGQVLLRVLRGLGIDMRRDCWITNAAVCRPERNILPAKSIDYCRPNIVAAVKKLKPHVIIPLGASAVQSLMGWLWKEEEVEAMSKWAGWRIPCQKINAWIAPTWHPSYIMRLENAPEGAAAHLLFRKHLKAAFALKGRPWERVPDYKHEVLPYTSSERATVEIENLLAESRWLAFDYETDCLKPEGGGTILCCSLSNGLTTVAFPWHGPAREWMQRVLLSEVPKIASNQQFEERWSRQEFGHGVKHWGWDTMLAAHTLDSRSGITSVKFQAFIRLGQPDYDSHVKPYFESKGSYARNRIREVPVQELLTYNALDSLLEYKVCMLQRREMGLEYDAENVKECSWLEQERAAMAERP